MWDESEIFMYSKKNCVYGNPDLHVCYGKKFCYLSIYEVMQNLNCLNIMLNCSDTVVIDDLKELGKNFMQSQAQ